MRGPLAYGPVSKTPGRDYPGRSVTGVWLDSGLSEIPEPASFEDAGEWKGLVRRIPAPLNGRRTWNRLAVPIKSCKLRKNDAVFHPLFSS